MEIPAPSPAFSPGLFPGAGIAAAAVALGEVGRALAAVAAGAGLQAQAPARHPGRLVHGGDLVLLLKL